MSSSCGFCKSLVSLMALFALVVLLTSCTTDIGCEAPYIDYTDDECCLDEDVNGLCDFQDEVAMEIVEDDVESVSKPELVKENEVVVYEEVLHEDPIVEPEIPPVPVSDVVEEEVVENNIVVVDQVQAPKNFEFDLREIEISKAIGDLEGQVKHNDFYLTTPDISSGDNVLVEFLPECSQSEANPLFLIVNGRRENGFIPKCQETNAVYLTKTYLKTGVNTLVFDTIDKQYFVDGIYVVTNVDDVDELKQNINRVLLNAFTKKIKIDDAGDIQIQRKKGFDVVLGKADMRDLLMSFEAEEAKGEIILEVNNKIVYQGAIDEGKNELRIPESALMVGRNNIFIIGN
jgi:hypothetical protein